MWFYRNSKWTTRKKRTTRTMSATSNASAIFPVPKQRASRPRAAPAPRIQCDDVHAPWWILSAVKTTNWASGKTTLSMYRLLFIITVFLIILNSLLNLNNFPVHNIWESVRLSVLVLSADKIVVFFQLLWCFTWVLWCSFRRSSRKKTSTVGSGSWTACAAGSRRSSWRRSTSTCTTTRWRATTRRRPLWRIWCAARWPLRCASCSTWASSGRRSGAHCAQAAARSALSFRCLKSALWYRVPLLPCCFS